MDVIRSRTCWTACVVVGLIGFGLVYCTLKKTSETNGKGTSTVIVQKNALEMKERQETTTGIPKNALEREEREASTGIPENSLEMKERQATTTGSEFLVPENALEMKERQATTTGISNYKPLEGFRLITDWYDFRTHGNLTARAADFQKANMCKRVVLFLAQGTILELVLARCDSMEPSMWLLMVNNSLYYYRRAMVVQGPTEKEFTVTKKFLGKENCVVTHYTVHGENRANLTKNRRKEAGAFKDITCNALLNFKMPSTLLLSMNGKTGIFTPGNTSDWEIVNLWEPLGATMRLYWYGGRCFRLLVITSYGRNIQAVKVSCGPVQNLVVTDDALYYSNALVVRRNTKKGTFDIIYNPKRSGTCLKEIIYFDLLYTTNVPTILKTDINQEDPDCQDLVNERIAKSTVNKDEVSKLMKSLQMHSSDYTGFSQWSYFNLPMDLGVAVVDYEGKEGLNIGRLLLMVAKGVPVTSVFVEPGLKHQFSMRNNVLLHENDISLRKIVHDENKFIAITTINNNFCLKKLYRLRDRNGTMVKENLASKETTKTIDEECRNLIEGNEFKVGKFDAEIDEFGVPMYLLTSGEFSGISKENKINPF